MRGSPPLWLCRRRCAGRPQPPAPPRAPDPRRVRPPRRGAPRPGHGRDDRHGKDRQCARMTVPVNIAGHGPYDFIVDTGSERTVVVARAGQRPRARAGAGRDRAQHDRGQPDPDRAHPGPRASASGRCTTSRPRRSARVNLGAAGHARRRHAADAAGHLRFPAPRDDGDAVASAPIRTGRKARSSSPRAAASAG